MRETLSLIEGQMEQPLANSLFPVYLSLQAIHKDKAFLQKRSVVILAPDSTAVIPNLFSPDSYPHLPIRTKASGIKSF